MSQEFRWLEGDTAIVCELMPCYWLRCCLDVKESTETGGRLGQWTRVDDLPIQFAWGLSLIATLKSIIVTGKSLDKNAIDNEVKFISL